MKSLINLGMAIGAAAATILIVEIVLHIVRPAVNYAYMPQDIAISHFQPSALLPAELRRNSRSRFKMLEFDTIVETNSLGLRDDEIDFSKPRILCLGDSFTFGYGVESSETFCSILERRFGGQFDFVNAGFADGFSPDSYALWLRHNIETVKPKAILVTLFQNDASEATSNRWLRSGRIMTEADEGWPDRIEKPGVIVTENGNLMRDTMLAKLPPLVARLLKNSYLVGLMRDRILKDAEKEVGGTTTNVMPQEIPRLKRSLALLSEAAQGRPIRFHLIAYPAQRELSPMDKAVLEFGGSHGIPVIYSYQDFTSREFFHFDPHWNRLGHEKAAAYLYPALLRLGL